VYLAGEGHHGLKARIAAWKHHNSVATLEMWLSKDGCDLNTPAGYQRVLDHVRKLPKSPELIVVDTLHRFLQGDENSAQDAKTMLDACGALMQEFNCSVVLVHHTGVSSEAQHRARGSSAWRGALDIEVSIVPAGKSAPMEIHQRKSKDAELSEPVYAELEQVIIPEWFDEDEQPVTSAVLAQAEAPMQAKKASPYEHWRKVFEAAWWTAGAELFDGKPYLTRSALLEYMTTELMMPESTAKKKLKPGEVDGFASALVPAGYLSPLERGWVVVNEQSISALVLSKNERKKDAY